MTAVRPGHFLAGQVVCCSHRAGERPVPVSTSSHIRCLSATLSQNCVGRWHFDRRSFEVPSARTGCWISIWLDFLPPVPSDPGSTNPVPTGQDPLWSWFAASFLSCSCGDLDNGVPECAVLLDGKVVISALPVLIGAGDYPHPASLAPWFTP